MNTTKLCSRRRGSLRRRLVVLRNGRTSWNVERRFQGRRDLPLDDVGRAQADAAAEELERLDPSLVLTSDATRAQQTALFLMALMGVPLVLEPRLRETDIGSWEGLTRDEVRQRFPGEYADWRRGVDVPRGGGETYVEVAARAVPAVEDALAQLEPSGTLVVVTHGGTARAVIGRLLELEPTSWCRLPSLAHGRWSVLEEVAFGWRLEEHNEPWSGQRIPVGLPHHR